MSKITKIIIGLSVVAIYASLESLADMNQVLYEAPKQEPIVVRKTQQQIIANKIKEVFPENPKVMVAIAIEESRLNPKAKGYNCYYKLDESGVYDPLLHRKINITFVYKQREKGVVSTFCRKGHEAQAWSSDGGIFQINGKHVTDVDHNLELARHKYDTQGLDAWVSYNTGRYKKHLPEATKLLQ